MDVILLLAKKRVRNDAMVKKVKMNFGRKALGWEVGSGWIISLAKIPIFVEVHNGAGIVGEI